MPVEQYLRRQMVALGTAVMFLTRLPVPSGFSSADPAELSRSTRYFPLVGFIVGLMLAVSLWGLLRVFPSSVAVLLTILLGVRITGAFHEDGLADVADSAGAFDVDKKLQIMRDSRVGTYGSLALIGLMMLKWQTILELVQVSLLGACLSLLAAQALSRWSSVWLMTFSDYARPEAANRVVAEGIGVRQLMEATICVLLIFLPLAFWGTTWVYGLIPVAALVSFVASVRYRQTLGGITGDCLGATNQIVEVLIYLTVLACLGNQ